MPSMRFTPDDSQLLARYQESKPWNDAEESVRNAIKDLWNHLKNVAIEAARRYSRSTKVKEFSSHPTPNGRTQKELWSCVYPKVVQNKSYGLHIAICLDCLKPVRRDLFLPWFKIRANQLC